MMKAEKILGSVSAVQWDPQHRETQTGEESSRTDIHESAALIKRPFEPAGTSAPNNEQHNAWEKETGNGAETRHNGYDGHTDTGDSGMKNRTISGDDVADDAERLDPSYRRIQNKHVKNFFKPGRVFAILWTEPAAAEKDHGSDMSDAFSIVRYRGHVHTEVRRFIVVKGHNWHSICVPITTYRNRGSVGRVDADSHAIAYTTNDPPQQLQGEKLERQAIKIQPVGEERLKETSRINFSKLYTVEHNVKVKPIGRVPDEYLKWLKYYVSVTNGFAEPDTPSMVT